MTRSTLSGAQRRTLELLADGEEIVKTERYMTDTSLATVHSHTVAALTRSGLIERDGDRYSITDAGREALSG